jgi:hypothetical protein
MNGVKVMKECERLMKVLPVLILAQQEIADT